jgi:hypothetical protein
MLVAGVLTLLPTIVDESMNLLNMGSYMSYALRFGFLNALYFLGGACLCLESICYKPLHAFDGKPLAKLSEEETPTTETVCVEEGEKKNEGGMVAFNEENFEKLLSYDCIAYGMGTGVSHDRIATRIF